MNNANPQFTNEQALQILTDLANLDTLKLNLKEHSAVQLALHVFKNLVQSQKAQPEPTNPLIDKIVELTPTPATPTI